jgi:curved DNA-binding protein CbpA
MGESPMDHQQQDLYERLQVSPRATPAVIQAAYRVLARSYHPDISRDPDAAHLMRELNAAYDVLSDPARRAQYDAERARAARVLRTRRTVRIPHNERRARAAAFPAERGTVSPAIRIVLALVIVALIGAIIFVLWLVYDALDDRPLRAVQPPGIRGELAVHHGHWSPLDVFVAESAHHLPRLCEPSPSSSLVSC